MPNPKNRQDRVCEVWCERCNRQTEEAICSICGKETREDTPSVVFWCPDCNIPILHEHSSRSISCPLCGASADYLCTDLRPVFPEERLLYEVIRDRPFKHLEDSVWADGSKYYINGVPDSISVKEYESLDIDKVIKDLRKHKDNNNNIAFDDMVKRFTEANREHLQSIYEEAAAFVRDAATDYPEENLVVSFSGGKDSTVTADIAVRALSNPCLVHIFGDTTLEFPSTIEYARRFKCSHPMAIFKTARNDEQEFYKVADIIGPPARMTRWCCSMFKTGPISRVFNSMYRNQDILTFYGIRKRESVSRSKYNRTEDSAESVKIQRQKVASPVFFWSDLEIWLYILSEEIDFNEAYRLGYDRVGCWCCPNNNPKAQFLSKVYMPEESRRWRDFLVSFAKRIGKPDPEVYVDEGWWKARQGGNGLAAAESVKVRSNQCATEDNAFVFSLDRPYSEELEGLFTPLGIYTEGLGRKLVRERVFLDPRTRQPSFAIMPFTQGDSEHSIKVRVLDETRIEEILMMAKYQIIKFNACRQCLKCESLCRYGAISISMGAYQIDSRKCMHCYQCVTDKYLEGGCLMRKYLRTKEQDQ